MQFARPRRTPTPATAATARTRHGSWHQEPAPNLNHVVGSWHQEPAPNLNHVVDNPLAQRSNDGSMLDEHEVIAGRW
jgi:hypothetical protein